MQSKFVFLSHVLSSETIGYGGKKQFSVVEAQSMKSGGSCNQSEWNFNNHIGTHIDAPFHFSSAGKTIDKFSAKDFVFDRPQLITINAEASQVIDVGAWCESIYADADLLLLKTGFEKLRDSADYWAHNPGLSPDLGKWLRKNRPSIRAVGMDVISLTSYDHRALGREAHKAFLHEDGVGQPLILIEDMALAELHSDPKRVVVAPLRVAKSDGSPVTVIAEVGI